MESGVNIEAAYERNWKEFETGFWETEVNSGRRLHSRSSIFLNHWLIAGTGEEIVAREVFSRFKRYADIEAGVPMAELLEQLRRAAVVYRSFVESATNSTASIDRLGLFAYRTSTLESEVFKPLILVLLDPEQPPLEPGLIDRSLDVVESWLVRRMLVRASAKAYNLVSVVLIRAIGKVDRSGIAQAIEDFFQNQDVVSRYWPDDHEVRSQVMQLMAYKQFPRARLRMVLESIEDHRRGWRSDREGLGGQRVPRGPYTIEHIMPHKWVNHWPLCPAIANEAERDHLVHTLGNLPLLTKRLNSAVSNGPWSEKRLALNEHDILKMNKDLMDQAGDTWADESIRSRTSRLVDSVVEIWPAPPGHRSGFAAQPERPRHKVEIAFLINAGMLATGSTLYARPKKYRHRTATVLHDGGIEVAGVVHATLSGAATAIRDTTANGWQFFGTTPNGERSLADVWREYLEQTSVDVYEVDVLGEDDDDE